MADKIYTLPKQFHPDFSSPHKKPIGPVAVDWDNKLTTGLTHVFWPGRDGYINLIDSESALTNGTSGREVNPFKGAVSLTSDGTSGGANFVLEGFTGGPNFAIGFFSRCWFNNGTQDHTVIDKQNGGVGSIDMLVWADTSGGQLGLNFYSGTTISAGSGTLPINEWVNISGSFWDFDVPSGDQCEGAINGIISLSGNPGTVNTVASKISALTDAGNTRITDGAQQCLYLWDRRLTVGEHKALSDYPFQILKPAVDMPYIVPAAAGGLSIPIAAYHYNHNLGSNA